MANVAVEPMNDTLIQCPSCASDAHGAVLEVHEQWRLFECATCGLRYFWPAKNPGPAWYQASEIYFRRDAMAVDWMWYHEAGLRMLPKRRGRLLDVGCGTGGFVAAAQRRGFDATGIDFSPKAIEAGARTFGVRGLQCMSTESARETFGDASFDVVTAFEVLEHMDDVDRFMRDLTALLAPGGRLIVSVPNRDRRPRLLNEGDLPPHHFTRWDAAALRTVFRRHGLAPHRLEVCPPWVTLKAFILFYTRFGVVVRLLERAEATPEGRRREQLRSRMRAVALLKDRIAGALALIPSVILAPWIRGPMLVGAADRPSR